MDKDLHIGVTASRYGITFPQRMRFMQFLLEDVARQGEVTSHITLRHGCCVGGDADAAVLAHYLGLWVTAYPPTEKQWFSNIAYDISDQVRAARPYLERNRNIVEGASMVYAMPQKFKPSGGGTWYTIEYAQARRIPITIIFPDGTHELVR